MTTKVNANITIAGTYPNCTYTFDGDDISAGSGDLDLSSVSGEVELKFKIKTSGFNFYAPASGNAPLSIGAQENDQTPANDWDGEFKSYSKTDSKNLKVTDLNADGVDYYYSLSFTDGTNHWTLDPRIKNSDAA